MKKAELVFVAVPAMGHLISAVQLAKLLVRLNSNVSVTFLTFKPLQDTKTSAYIDSLTAINLSQSYPEVDAFKLLRNLAQTVGPLVKEEVVNIVEHSNSDPNAPRLAGFVLDSLLACLVELGNEFGVHSYAFYTSGAGSLGFHHYAQALHDEQKIEFGELKDSDTEFTVPSYVNPVSIKLFLTVLLHPEIFSVFGNLIKWIGEVKGILINTFSELESHAIDNLSKGKLQIPPIYPVGPILNLEGSSKVHQNYDSVEQWLDEQPPSSVVFLCFGSLGSFGTDQVKEIAYAIEQSGHRFLWSLRRPGKQPFDMAHSATDYENVVEILPEGFLDRTTETGKVIGWAPQVAILSHPAIGGFASHCGWNSILESIWFGVPMMAWPLYAEQQLNALTLVKELGLAVELKMDYKVDDGEVEIIKANKIEEAIRSLMGHDSDVRRKMKKMSEGSRKALTEGGSSHTMLCRFIDDIINNMP